MRNDGPAQPRGYAKPVALPDQLNLLRGPTTGVVTLPQHLDWSREPTYDLGTPGRIVDLYRTVIIEATKPDDLHRFLDETNVRRLWPRLWLPSPVRAAWQDRFPDLTKPERPAKAA